MPGFTRAGCSYGAVASANTVLENTRSDIPQLFGAGSPEDQELQASLAIPCGFGSNPPCTPDQQRAKNQPQADFVGLAVHCGRNDRRCAGAHGARPDLLPDEPGGYQGFSALFGAKYVDPLISPGSPATDLDGKVTAGVRRKFELCAAMVLREGVIAPIADAIGAIDTLADMRMLTELLTETRA